jgi:hypothetical protein
MTKNIQYKKFDEPSDVQLPEYIKPKRALPAKTVNEYESKNQKDR